MRLFLTFLTSVVLLATESEWHFYGRDPGGERFSPLRQINRENVSKLKVAWSFATGEPDVKTAFEATPLMIEGVLYFSTSHYRVIALDAETGKPIWEYNDQAGVPKRKTLQNRGLTYWKGRIFAAGINGTLLSLDAKTGKPVVEFGDNGRLYLRSGVAEGTPEESYNLTSPPAIYKDLIITGAQVPEPTPQGPSGMVRAFHAGTGKLVWKFNTIPQPGEFGHDTWEGDSWKHRTGVNVWSLMSVDEKRGLIFLPTGSPSYDFYGGDRKGSNLFANSLIALDAKTGRRVWHHQLVHHDIWDYDLPAMPMLLRIAGKDAVVQLTKMGLVFVFDRVTGKPLFPIEERPVPQSDVPGEKTWPTQPIPAKPPPLSRMELKESEVSSVTPEAAKYCRQLFASAVHKGLYTPWTTKMTLAMPGTLGGATWSGGSFDPSTNLLYVNVNEFGAIGRLEKQSDGTAVLYRRRSPSGEYMRFGTMDLWPCQAPPWGSLVAVDL
ncbi:MAG: PQQ-binding-like beta-propeller repeat protein, partial [Bryobacteraceae bacterium]